MHAQAAGNDKAELLAFKAGGATGGAADNDLASWDPSTLPCDEGWDTPTEGWIGVMCCESYDEYAHCTGASQRETPVNAGRVTMLCAGRLMPADADLPAYLQTQTNTYRCSRYGEDAAGTGRLVS